MFSCCQGTASEATLVALLAARTRKLAEVDPEGCFEGLIDKLVCYCSQEVSNHQPELPECTASCSLYTPNW